MVVVRSRVVVVRSRVVVVASRSGDVVRGWTRRLKIEQGILPKR